MTENEQGTELSTFIHRALGEINNGFKETPYHLPQDVKFEVSVTKIKNIGGKIRLFVAEADGDMQKQTVQKLTFTTILNEHPAIRRIRQAQKMADSARSLDLGSD